MKREQLRLFALTQTEEALFPIRRLLATKLTQWGESGGVPFAPLTDADPQTFSCAVGHVMRFVSRVRHPDEFGPEPQADESTPALRAARIPQLLENHRQSVATAQEQVDMLRDFAATIGAAAPKPDFTPVIEPPAPPEVTPEPVADTPPTVDPEPAKTESPEPAIEKVAETPETETKPVKKPRRRKAKTPPAQ